MIEFINGEPFCRWNGTLMNEKNHKKLFGVQYELDMFEDDIISFDGVYYTDLPFGKLVMSLAEKIVEKVEDYDDVLDKGYGWSGWCEEKELEGKMIIPIDMIKDMTVKPFQDFYKKYPKFNKEKYLEFYDELDEYYDNLKKCTSEKGLIVASQSQ